MLCPACKSTELKMSDRQGVEIDYCPSCRGIWLDRGELDKIIDRASGELAQPNRHPQQQSQPAVNPASMYDSDYGKPYHKKRKHWLLEILD